MEDLGGWEIQQVYYKRYVFPSPTLVAPGSSVTIWSHGCQMDRTDLSYLEMDKGNTWKVEVFTVLTPPGFGVRRIY